MDNLQENDFYLTKYSAIFVANTRVCIFYLQQKNTLIMKVSSSLLWVLTLLLFFTTSCDNSDSPETVVTYTLSTIPIDGNTIEGNVWCITDKEAESDDFATLRESLSSIATTSRKITLQFPNLTTLYQGALSDLKWDDIISNGLDDDTYNTYKNSIHSSSSLDALVSVVMDAATLVESHAFHSCSSLASVTLSSATTVGEEAFMNCASLSTIEMPTATTLGNDAFVGCNAMKSVSFPSIATVEDGAFQGCTQLKEVTLASATTICEDVFSGCTSLATLSLPNATTIHALAFYNCTSLTAVDLPSVTTLESGAFKDCTSLYSISLPKATHIGMMVLSGCKSLTYLTAATESDVVMIYSSMFGFDSTTQITLSTGKDNNTTVSSNYWSVPNENGESYLLGAFSQIITK